MSERWHKGVKLDDLITKLQLAYNFLKEEWFLFLREKKETEEERN